MSRFEEMKEIGLQMQKDARIADLADKYGVPWVETLVELMEPPYARRAVADIIDLLGSSPPTELKMSLERIKQTGADKYAAICLDAFRQITEGSHPIVQEASQEADTTNTDVDRAGSAKLLRQMRNEGDTEKSTKKRKASLGKKLTEEHFNLMGKVPDKVIAEMVGYSTAYVCAIRNDRGIASFRAQKKAAKEERSVMEGEE